MSRPHSGQLIRSNALTSQGFSLRTWRYRALGKGRVAQAASAESKGRSAEGCQRAILVSGKEAVDARLKQLSAT